MDLEKVNRRPWGREGEKIVTEREGGKSGDSINTENKLRVDGGQGRGENG